jgi:EPS-associated MarR family transcriptional regulator
LNGLPEYVPVAIIYFIRILHAQRPAVACLHNSYVVSLDNMVDQELEYRALKILEQHPDLTQRQLAEQLGVSLGKTHYLVKSLIDVGWVKLDNFQRSDNKWGYAYLLTPMGIVEKAAITARFLVRKQREHTQLQEEIIQLQKEVRQQQNLK